MELIEFIAVFAVCAIIWNVVEWLGAMSEEATQRTRALELDNDRKEIENDKLRDEEPDMYCVTERDGSCISNHPKCMHNKYATKR